MPRNTLWEKKIGSVTIGAYEDPYGIISIEGGVVISARTSYSRQAAESANVDLEEHSKQKVLAMLKDAVDAIYNEMRS